MKLKNNVLTLLAFFFVCSCDSYKSKEIKNLTGIDVVVYVNKKGIIEDINKCVDCGLLEQGKSLKLLNYINKFDVKEIYFDTIYIFNYNRDTILKKNSKEEIFTWLQYNDKIILGNDIK